MALSEIEDLIDGTSAEKRAALFDEMAGVLAADGDGLLDEALEFCGDVIMRLLARADSSARREMAARLAGMEGLPSAFVSALAGSEIRIAAPVLRLAPAIDEATLIEVARARSDDHCLAMAPRRDLTEAATVALLERGSMEIAIAVANNRAVTLSEKSVDLLARQASGCPALEEVLCGRQDLPDGVAHKVMRTVSMRLQLQVGSMMADFDAATTRLALRTSHAETSYEVSDRLHLSQDAIVEVSRMSSRGEITEASLARFIAGGKAELAACIFARLAKLEPAVARRILLDPQGETLAVAARAIPLGADTYRSLVMLIAGADSGEREAIDTLVARYEAIEVRSARKVMEFHKRRRRIASTRRSESARPHDIDRAAPASA